MGSEYYSNISRSDVDRVLREIKLASYLIVINERDCDLYFAALTLGAGEIDVSRKRN
jgi:hypothetical protein